MISLCSTMNRGATRRFPSAFLLLALFASLLPVLPPSIAHALTAYYVHPLGDDTHDCRGPEPQRACRTIGAAVTKAGEADLVRIAAGMYTENLVINKSVQLIGAAADPDGTPRVVIDGGDAGSVMRFVGPGRSIASSIERLSLRNGRAELGGGIFNADNSTLVIRASMIMDNEALRSPSGAGGHGGGIFNDGALSIFDSTISGNLATRFGGGISHASNKSQLSLWRSLVEDNQSGERGGGIYSEGFLELQERSEINGNRVPEGLGGGIFGAGNTILKLCSMAANRAASGGGIYMRDGSTLTLIDCTVENNQAVRSPSGVGGIGGGLVNLYGALISKSTFAGNSATTYAGAIANYGVLNINLSTISGNSAQLGGGIYNTATLKRIDHSTIARNTASVRAGGILNIATGSVQLLGTILAANQAPLRPDCEGSLRSLGYNLLGTNSELEGVRCIAPRGIGDIFNDDGSTTDPLLGPLQDNGGPTRTHAPQVRPVLSPVIDTGIPPNPAGYSFRCPDIDQRGAARPVDGDGDGEARCDIGAVEVGGAPPPILYLTRQTSSETAVAGVPIDYSLIASVSGVTATVELVDSLPAGLNFVAGSATGGATYDRATHTVRFSGSVAPGAPMTLAYRATPADGLAPGTVLSSVARLSNPARRSDRPVTRIATVVVPSPVFTGALVMLYVAGDNDLAERVYDLLNSAEQALRGRNDLKVLAVVDTAGAGNSFLYHLQPDERPNCPSKHNPSCDGRYSLGTTLLAWDENLASKDSLSAFVNLGYQLHPQAGMRILSLAGHGGGWSPEVLAGQPSGHGVQPGDDILGGMLWDNFPGPNQRGTSLSTAGLAEALRDVTSAAGRKPLDLVFLDACNMASVEVLYPLAGSARYLLASPNWKWSAFPYEAHLRDVRAGRSVEQIGLAWLRNEAAALHEAARQFLAQEDAGENFPYPFTYGLFDLNQLPALDNAVGQLASALEAKLTAEPPIAGVRNAIIDAYRESDCYDSNQDGTIATQTTPVPDDGHLDSACDLGSFAARLESTFASIQDGTQVVTAARALRQALGHIRVDQPDERFVQASAFNSGEPWLFRGSHWAWREPAGLSVFLPFGQDNWRRRFYPNLNLGARAWDKLIDSFWQGDPPTAPTCNQPCQLPPGPAELPAIRLGISPGYTSMTLHWSWEGPDPRTTFRLWRGAAGGELQPIAASLSGERYHDQETELVGNTTYCYKVEAISASGGVVASSNVSCGRFGRVNLSVPRDSGASPGTSATLPIELSQARGMRVAELKLRLRYDPAVLTPIGQPTSALPGEGYSVSQSIVEPGVLELAARATSARPNELAANRLSVFSVSFSVANTPGVSTTLQIDRATTSITAIQDGGDTAVPFRLASGTFYVNSALDPGQVDGIAGIQASDVATTLAIASGQYAPTWEQRIAGDVNRDGSVGADDASLLASAVASEDLAHSAPSATAASEVVHLRLGPARGAPGSIVSTVLRADHVRDLAGGQFMLYYDPALIERILSVEATGLAEHFAVSFNDNRAGLLRIAMAQGEPSAGSGALLVVVFRLRSDAALWQTSPLRLAEARLNDAAGQDFAESALRRTIERTDGVVGTGVYAYMPLIAR